METASLWINLFGNVLVVVGIGWAGWELIRTERLVRSERQAMQDAKQRVESEGEPFTVSEEWRRLGLDFLTSGDLVYLKQDVELAIIRHLRPNLRGPFLATLLGTVLTLVSAVIALT